MIWICLYYFALSTIMISNAHLLRKIVEENSQLFVQQKILKVFLLLLMSASIIQAVYWLYLGMQYVHP